MSSYRRPMMDALNEGFHDHVKAAFAAFVVSGDTERLAAGLERLKARWEQALDAVMAATADEE